MSPDIYQYVKSEESNFESEEIQVGLNWNWNMRNHIQMIFHLKNGKFFTGANDWMRPFKNIMQPILNLSYWSEDIEVKDIIFYIESATGRVLSFLIKKYHDEVYVHKYNLDTFIDEITESDIDYGGALVQKTNSPRPEVFSLVRLAFADQTDMLGSPMAFKHYFTPDKLRKMEKVGWGKPENGATMSINELCTLATYEKDAPGINETKTNRVPGKSIEVYIVRGSMPEHYLEDNDDMEYFCNQVQIIAYYTNKDKKQQGVTLYRKKEDESVIKFHTSKKVEGRALGESVGETLLSPQIWTNFAEIHKTKMLEAGSKIPLFTDDQNYKDRNVIQDMENLEITTINPESRYGIRQVPTAAPVNIQLMERNVDMWFSHAQLLGSAFDPLLGKEPNSGTTFRGQERVVAQGKGLHDRRRGQRAKFIEEVYREFIIPRIVSEITSGKKFLATLTADELAWVSEQLAENYAFRKQSDALFNFEVPVDKDILKAEFKEKFGKKGNKHILEILKDEFADIEVKIGIDVAGKQKDLAMLSDKILSIFQFVFANPAVFQQAMQVPSLAKAFKDILEFSGMSEVDFSSLINMKPMASHVAPEQVEAPMAPLGAQA